MPPFPRLFLRTKSIVIIDLNYVAQNVNIRIISYQKNLSVERVNSGD